MDASAVLALLHRERGGELVHDRLHEGIISAINWSEVIQKARARGIETGRLASDFGLVGFKIVPFDFDEAERSASLWFEGGRRLSLADRACLATGLVRDLPVLTADRLWAELATDAVVELIR